MFEEGKNTAFIQAWHEFLSSIPLRIVQECFHDFHYKLNYQEASPYFVMIHGCIFRCRKKLNDEIVREISLLLRYTMNSSKCKKISQGIYE